MENDLNLQDHQISIKNPGFSPVSERAQARSRAKTSQRLKYEAEIMVLKKEIGGLEDLRIKLGFSRRKICQLLMVDPSAWTRWTAENQDAPPHIYRALKWYLDSKTHQISRFETQIQTIQASNQALIDQIARLEKQQRQMRIFISAISAAMIGLLTYFGWLFAMSR